MKIITSIVLVFLFSLNTYAQENPVSTQGNQNVEYYKVSKVRIFVNDRSEIQELRKQGLGIERVKYEDGYFDTFLDSYQINKLKKSGYQYDVIIDDVTKDYLERTKESREKIKLEKSNKDSGFGYGSMGGFYTFDEVVAELDNMHSLYPNLITAKDSIGSSYQGRPIWAVKISDNPGIDEDEPEIFYNSLIHAREPEGMMAVVYFMYYLLENYGLDPEVTYLVDNRELYFMPVINPDGYVHNQNMSPEGGGMWRKNLRNVDLNRNFGYMWGYDDIGSSPLQPDETYRGIEAFSESETQAVRDFCNTHNFLICNNYHSYWNVVLTPWGYNLSQTSDSTIFNATIKLGTQINDYKNGHFILDNYPTNGDAYDWMYGEQTTKSKIFAYLTEVGNYDDWFWPIPERIFPLAEENCYLNKVLAWGPQVIDNPPYISDASLNTKYCRPLIDTIKISAVESNPDNHSSTVTAKIFTYDNILVDEIQLDQTDSFFNGSLVLNSAEEKFYKVILEQNGNDIPSKLFYDNLNFTTAGPVEINSFKVTRIDSSSIYLHDIYFTNKSQLVTMPILYVKAKSDDNCISVNNSKKLLGNLNPLATAKISEGYFINIEECSSDSIELVMEISNGKTAFWESKFKVEIPSLLEIEETTTAMHDEANDLANWESLSWGITTENFVSEPSSFTDSPYGNYSPSSTATLSYKNRIKYLNVLKAYLEFDAQWEIEYGFDYGQVQLSVDNGSNWIALSGQYSIPPGSLTFVPNTEPIYTGIQSDWIHETIDISKYANQEFKLKFILRSDPVNNKDGWYIDNIKVSTYSTILAEQPYINKTFAQKNTDSLLFQIKLFDLYNHHFTAHVFFSNTDNTDIDSVTLFDDGLHGDSLANDNIYGCFIPPRNIEGFYSLGLSTNDHQTNNSIKTADIFKFTTMPLTVDSTQSAAISNFRYTIKPFLRNAGEDETIKKITVKVSSNDPWVTEIFPEFRTCPNLLPGQSLGISQPFAVGYDSSSFPGYFNLKYTILSEGVSYWEMDTTIYVTPVNVEIEDKTPLVFNLEQNYPNPFNPTTTIKYQIPAQDRNDNSNVLLKVYDILGSEVATLVNEKQKTGYYEVEFDGFNLTSGIYFYRINAGNFRSTKKMILIK